MKHVIVFLILTKTIFAFTQLEMVRDVSLEVMWQTGCGCMVVLYPLNPTAQQDRFLTRLTFALAKEEARQVMSYTFEQYLQYYYTQESQYNTGSCLKTLNIVVVTSSTQNQMIQLSKSHIFTKSIWLLFANDAYNTAMEMNKAHLGINSGVWIVKMHANFSSTIYEIFKIDDGYPLRYTELGRWTQKKRLEMTEVAKPLRRRNLEEKNFNVGVLDRNTDLKKTKLLGFFPSIWRELQLLLNFRTTIYKSIDGSAGFWWNKNWTGLIGMMLRKEIDAIITELDYSKSRLDAVEHLLPLQKTKMQVYFRPEGYLIDWLSVLKPFSISIWTCLLIWIFLASIALYSTITVSATNGLRGAKEQKTMNLINCIFFVLQTVCVQGSNWIPRIWATRVIFLICYLLAAVMLPAYSASLISSLTTKTPFKPFDSLNEMLVTDYRLLVRKNSNRYEYFLNATDPNLQLVFEKLVLMVPDMENNLNIKDFDEAAKYACEMKNIALFATESDLETYFPYGNTPCGLVQLSDPLGAVYQSMAFPKMSPYRDTFNYFILRMSETGILDRLERKYQPRWSRIKQSPEIPVTILDVVEIFAFLAISICFSIFLLIIEIIIKKIKLC